MKKLIALLLAMVMVIGMLAGCSKKTNKKSSGSKKSGSSQHDDEEETKGETEGTKGETEGTKGETEATSGKKEENKDQNDGTAAAVTDAGHKLDSVTMNYYLVDAARSTYQNIQSYYGDMAEMYLSYMGLDINKPLNTQYYQEAQTWAAYFLDTALEQAKSDLALCDKAKAAGFQLPAADRETIANHIKTIEDKATFYGYPTVDQFLVSQYGDGASLDSYNAYIELSTLAYAYYSAYGATINPTDEQIRQYGEEYLSDLSDTQYVANVRHLLVEFEGGTTDPMGGTVYSDEDKATAKAEAERLLQLWKDSAATEESFAALVTEHTDDPGSKETGGLYENIHAQTPFVEAFLNWSIDPARKTGDVAIVGTEYGYHIMYFSGYGEMTHRDFVADEKLREELLKEWYVDIIDDLTINATNTDGLKVDLIISSLG